MGIGLVGITTSQKRELSGAPFAAGAADNGLSVDAVTGQIVLGNDAGDPAAPAALRSNREIVMEDTLGNAFSILLNAIQSGPVTTLTGTAIDIIGGILDSIRLQLIAGDGGSSTLTAQSGVSGFTTVNLASGNSGFTTLNMSSDLDLFSIQMDGGGLAYFLANGIVIWEIDINNLTTQFGPTITAFNGATVQVTGTLTNRIFTQGQGAGTYNVDRDLDSGKIFFNSAAANLALPNMAGSNLRAGFIVRAACNNVAGITVTAAAGQIIRFGSLATTSGGTLTTTDVGATLKLILIDQSTWVTESTLGAWSLT